MCIHCVDSNHLLSKGGAGRTGLKKPVPVEASWNQGFLHPGCGLFLQAAHLISEFTRWSTSYK